MIRIEKGEYLKADFLLQKKLYDSPNDNGLLTLKIICDYYLKRYGSCCKEGEKSLLNIQSLEMKHQINLHLFIGYSLLQLNKYNKAEGYFEKYEEMEKSLNKKYDFEINRANTLIQLHHRDWKDIINRLDNFLSTKQDHILAIKTKLKALKEYKKEVNAKEHYERCKIYSLKQGIMTSI